MELQIFSPQLELIGVVDAYTSLIWRSRYHKCGDFELHCPLIAELTPLLQCGNLVYKGQGNAGYIETVEISNDMANAQSIVAKGRLCAGYLGTRINWNQLAFTGPTEALIRSLVSDNCITPADGNRVIPGLVLGDAQGYPETISYQDSYGNLLECIENISATSGLGFSITLNPQRKELVFQTIKGVDRTVNQPLLPPVIFSKRFDTLTSLLYVNSTNNYRSTALVEGKGEEEEQEVVVIGGDNAGLERQELYVNASSVSRGSGEDALSEEEYQDMLLQKGQEQLQKCTKVKTFDATVDTKGSIRYGEDFMVGDMVTVTDDACGVTLDTRITEVEEVCEGSGQSVNIIFGNNIPTLTDKIKQKLR